MTNQSQMDRLFMQSAMQLAKNSDDRSTQVGCVITDADDKVIGGGCNSFPLGVDSTLDVRHERPEKYDWIEHAERNAIFDAARKGKALKGSKMHLPWFPCTDCARAVVQSGIVELVCHEPDFSDERWGEKFVTAHKILTEGGVSIRYVDPEIALEDFPADVPTP
ncbi:deaminase [Roseibium sp. RKSG952]|uniref:deoxycytidylate deaminase n=1 Tax=Roseibium sp. RKSG952 TaxID=2529384 RepID=UPI0012BCB719|nr:deaminase [Roseibium sp. RKSG952]MTH95318.1 CMP deaminase [Roseibium sp. RKSG952]